MSNRASKIKVIGLPPGKCSLSDEFMEEILTADVLAGGRNNVELFPEARGKRIILSRSLDSFLESLKTEYENNRKIVFLTTGDPMIFGPVKNLLSVFELDQLEIINTVSPLQLALARLGIDIEGSVILSLHGGRKRESSKPKSLLEKVFFFPKSIIYTDPNNNPASISEVLISIDRVTESWRGVVCQKLGQEDERITEATVGEIALKSFDTPNIFVIFNPSPVELKRPGNFGIPDYNYCHQGGMITHPEIRAISLSKLELSGCGILWDVGAASGSVGIEANGLYGITVYAIEKHPGRFQDLLVNCANSGSKNLIPVKADILEVGHDLPSPDRIFIGGGGEMLIDIFKLCMRKLKPGGKIVCNLITIDSVSSLYSYLKEGSYPFDVTTISVARGTPIQNMLYMKAENTITLFEISKREKERRN